MTSPVTKAMIESYALMVMVMGTFFVYFCGMVWAFCNPKLSGAEEEQQGQEEDEEEEEEEEVECGKQAAGRGDRCWVCAPERDFRCACAHLPAAPPYTAEGLTHTTYVNFLDDTHTLLSESDCTAFCREDHGINNRIADISEK